MPKANGIPKDLLSLAGEHRVACELCRQGVFATITPGNRKQTDLYAINDATKRFARIEVKTSQTDRFVTGIFQRKARSGYNPPEFWVLVSLKGGSERFFVLTNSEIEDIQQKRNGEWQEGYRKRNPGKEFDPRDGVDNLLLQHVKDHENAWKKILDGVGRRNSGSAS